MSMRTLTLLTILATASAGMAQSVADVMEALTTAANELQAASKQRDRAAVNAQAQAIRKALPALRKAGEGMQHPAAAKAAIDALQQAANDLQQPIGDGVDSDRWDLSQLRAACTRCHVHNRDENEVRGLFPNRGTALSGAIELTDRDGKAIADKSGIVVFLEHVDDKPEPQPRAPTISQRGRRFDPAVLVVTAGTTVRFPNDDVVFHNVFSLSRGNAFDLGTYGKGKERHRTFTNTGLIKVHCNIHADMASHVLVLNSGRHAITAADGTWCIPDVPAGNYTLRVWHTLAKGQRQPLEVSGEGLVTVPLKVQETKVRVQHSNKHGRRYQKKY